MAKLTLLGARQFLDMPKGTFYTTCTLKDVEKFKSDPASLIDFKGVGVFGHNGVSMSFYIDEYDDSQPEEREKYNFMFCSDINVVGDADPARTLYLVLDDDFIPEVAQYDWDRNGYHFKKNIEIRFWGQGLILTKEQVFNARKEFLKDFENLDNATDWENDLERNWLDADTENAEIYNFRLECDIEILPCQAVEEQNELD